MFLGTKSPDPDKLSTGAWIYESGIWFIKKANGRWRCRAFDTKKKICKIYPYRPPVCRWFKCPHAKKTKLVRMPDNNYSIRNEQYTIILFSKRKLKKGKST